MAVLQSNPFPLVYVDIFVMILGWQLSLTPREGDHYLMSKLMVMASKESEYFLQTYALQLACLESESGGVCVCLCLMRVIG